MPSTVSQRPARLIAAAIVGLALIFAAEAHAFSLSDWEGGFQLGKWGAETLGSYHWDDQTHETAGQPRISTASNRYDEELQIRNEGFYLIDPRLLIGALGINLDFFQEEDRFENQSNSSNGIALGYDLNTTILGEEAYPSILRANRRQFTLDRDFGGRTEITNSLLEGSIRLREKNPLNDYGLYYFKSSLDVRRDESDQETRGRGRTYKFNQARNAISYLADKGFQTADLKFRWDFSDVETNSGGSHLGFQSQRFSLDYGLDFGPTLNRRWDSRVNYSTRSGSRGTGDSFFWGSEELHIDHYENLSTSYLYSLSHFDAEGTSSTGQVGQFRVDHRLYDNFSHGFALGGALQTFPNGDITSYWVGADSGYSHSIPWGGTFSLQNGGQYQINENNLASSQVLVIDEAHTAPASFGASVGFTLNNTFVITSSISVVDTRGGGRIPTEVNVDYQVVQTGSQTQIFPLPTSLIIEPGDPLAVSYIFQIPGDARYSTISRSINAGLNFSWIQLSFGHSDIWQTLLSGQGGGFLTNQTTDTAQIGVAHSLGPVEASGNAVWEKIEGNLERYTRVEFAQYLTYRPRWDTVLNMSGFESLIDYKLPKRQTSTRSLQFSVNRYASDGYISAFAGLRNIEDSQLPTETSLEAGIRLALILGKLRVSPGFNWMDQTFGTTKAGSLRFNITVARHFD